MFSSLFLYCFSFCLKISPFQHFLIIQLALDIHNKTKLFAKTKTLPLAQKRMSSSMHEVFHWGRNTSGPKKLSLSVAGSQIDFEGPPSDSRQNAAARYSARNRHSMVMVDNSQGEKSKEKLSSVDKRFLCYFLYFFLLAGSTHIFL